MCTGRKDPSARGEPPPTFCPPPQNVLTLSMLTNLSERLAAKGIGSAANLQLRPLAIYGDEQLPQALLQTGCRPGRVLVGLPRQPPELGTSHSTVSPQTANASSRQMDFSSSNQYQRCR
jgi:hypothetical protein